MAWKCKKEMRNESGKLLFQIGRTYEEQDDRGEANDIAICLISEVGHKIYLVDGWVRDFFDEIDNLEKGECKICGSVTKNSFNIEFKAVFICEKCSSSIFLQQAHWYVTKQ